MVNKPLSKNAGTDFEKIVANIQARIDPNASVTHNQKITDRLGHSRQFDVVIKGVFAGQEILGVIECKDLNKKVSTPEIEAFVTKSQDINANFKIVVSRRGFSKQGLEKAKHYGIQALSLMQKDKANSGFRLGSYWLADIYLWRQITLSPILAIESNQPITFNIHDAKINGKKVLDWFTNYLYNNHLSEAKEGWVTVEIGFEKDQIVELDKKHLCKGLQFAAERGIDKKRKFVGINADGFFDWQNSKVTIPPQENIMTDSVQANFMDWEDRVNDDFGKSDFINVRMTIQSIQFEKIENAIDLEQL